MIIKIRGSLILKIAFLILIVPFFIFCISWLSIIPIVFELVGLFIIIWKLWEKLNKIDLSVNFTLKGLFLLCVGALFFTYIGGIGGYFPQTFDTFLRNAIYRDLIFNSWPIFYEETNRALVYYFGYWLVPAGICKCFVPFFTEYEIWKIAKIILFIYTSFNIFIFYLCVHLTIAKRYKLNSFKFFVVLKNIVVIILWSPLSILGIFCSQILMGENGNDFWQLAITHPISIDHYVSFFAVENGNMLQLMNVYNQVIPAWIVICIFLILEEEISLYGVICFSLIICSPFPFIGIVTMMGVRLIVQFRQCKLLQVFSLQNIVSVLISIIPIMFYVGNEKMLVTFEKFPPNMSMFQIIISIILFIMLSFGIYVMLGIEKNRVFLLIVFIINIIMCFIRVGGTIDFSMRATIPFNTYCMISVIGTILECEGVSKQKRDSLLFILGIAAMVPIIEVCYLFDLGLDSGTMKLENDYLYSLCSKAGDGDLSILSQYTKFNPSDDFFFKFFTNMKCDICGPVFEYREMNNGEIVINRVSFTEDMVPYVIENTISDEINWDEIKSEHFSGIKVLNFNDKKTIPVIKRFSKQLSLEDIKFNWVNYDENFFDKSSSIAKVELVNDSAETISYCNPSKDSSVESGLAIELLDENMNCIVYPYVFQYTAHVIIPKDTETFLVPVSCPEESAKFIRWCFFYMDYDGNRQVLRDKKVYKIR